LIVFCVWPIFNGIKKDSNDFISAKNDIVAMDAQNVETENFKQNIGVYEPSLEALSKMFVDPADPVNFIKFLEDTASGDKVSSKISLPPSSQDSTKPVQNFILFQFSSKGGFLDMKDFLKKIEAGPYLIEIENLTIQNLEDKQNNNAIKNYQLRSVEAVFTIKVFTKPS